MSEEATVKSLDNILTRLALTQEANLQQVKTLNHLWIALLLPCRSCGI